MLRTVILLTLTLSEFIWANELNIINVRRNITLSDSDPIFRDFYVNGGEDSGLKKNMVVQVLRKVMVKDASGATSYGEVEIPVGQMKILAVYPRLAIAREYKGPSSEESPLIEQPGIMVGDRIETKNSYVDKGPKKTVQTTETSAPASLTPSPATTAVIEVSSLTPPGPTATANSAVPTTATPASRSEASVNESTSKDHKALDQKATGALDKAHENLLSHSPEPSSK